MDGKTISMQLRDQLASTKRRLGFFFGAGSSMAANVPGIAELTDLITNDLDDDVMKSIREEIGDDSNIEDILNRIRSLREVISKGNRWLSDDISEDQLTTLDNNICIRIREHVSVNPDIDLSHHKLFSKWLKHTQKNHSSAIELFTTNYDTLLEKCLDSECCPYFDGFIGSIEPYFDLSIVEADGLLEDLRYRIPPGIARIWKLHGSVNWHSERNDEGHIDRLVRFNKGIKSEDSDLMIFPSRDKYVSSRKLPYLAFQDRLKYFLNSGEVLFFISGYSWSDEHINDIILQALERNPRLAINAMMYDVTDEIYDMASSHRNLSVYNSEYAVVGGVKSELNNYEPDGSDAILDDLLSEYAMPYGDFGRFTKFLHSFVGWNFGEQL